MPLYEYKCDTCGIKTEELHGHDEEITFSCKNCNQTLKRAISLGSSYFKGTESDKTSNSNWRAYSDHTVETEINGETRHGVKRHDSGMKVREDSYIPNTKEKDKSKLYVLDQTNRGSYEGKKDYFNGSIRSVGHMSPKYFPKTAKEMDALSDKQDKEYSEKFENN